MSPQVRNAIAAAAIYIAAVGLAWYARGYGDWAETAITLAFIWLIVDRLAQHERDEDTRADVDQLGRDMDDVKAMLTGNDKPSTGRHAHGDNKPYYKPSPRPRSVA